MQRYNPMNLQQLLAAYKEKDDLLKSLIAKATGEVGASDEELAQAETLNTELTTLAAKIEQVKKLADVSAAQTARSATILAPAMAAPHPGAPAAGVQISGQVLQGGTILHAAPGYSNAPEIPGSELWQPQQKMIIPAGVMRTSVRNFKGGTRAENEFQAYRFGMWFLAAFAGNEHALKYCRETGLELKAHNERVNDQGGYLVPTEFDNTIIDLRETYGIFRKYAKVVPMMSNTKTYPRRRGGLTAYYVGEGEPITDSTKQWDRVQLTAKKLAVLTLMTSELVEDAAISIGDDLAGEIAYAFAKAEDAAGFIGDATSTYGGIMGLTQRLLTVDPNSNPANVAGIQVGTGTGFSGLVLGDFTKLMGILPQYVRTIGTPRFFASQNFFNSVMTQIRLSAGGVTAAEIAAGANLEEFLGYPVIISQQLPSVSATGLACFFGDLSLAALFGDRRQTTLALSEHLAFANDELALRGIERYDINVHDVGTTKTATNAIAGPIVGLYVN